MDRRKLEHYKDRKEYLDSKIRSYEERRDSIGRLAASYEGERVFNSRKVQDTEAEELSKLMDDIKQETEKLIAEGNKELKEINYLLDQLSNPVYSKILSKRYIEGKELKAIAEEEHYNYDYLCRLYGTALAEFDKLC